jgi:hypothetical protein
MQAAATGERETIMDEELSRLAKKNLSKFQQLNQRMQARGSGSNWTTAAVAVPAAEQLPLPAAAATLASSGC